MLPRTLTATAFALALSWALPSLAQTYQYRHWVPDLVVTPAAAPAPLVPLVPPPSSGTASAQTSVRTVEFGNVATNTTATRQVLLSNPGTAALTLTALPAVVGDAAFGAGLTSCGAVLNFGADCVTEVQFSPAVVGGAWGGLQFSTSLAGLPAEVVLTGVGYNPVVLTPANLPTGTQNSGYAGFSFSSLLSVLNEGAPDLAQVVWGSSGALPAGLSIVNGVLSGTPTVPTAGTPVQVTATYKLNVSQQAYTIVVNGVTLQVMSVSAGETHTCAVTIAGGVKCWGYDNYGQLGNDAEKIRSHVPVNVFGLTSGAVSVSVGESHSCALTTGGGVKCWGRDALGTLGDNSARVDKATPVDVQGLTSGVASISAGFNHVCAVTVAGGAKCWGNDDQGQIGNSTSSEDTGVPVNVVGLTSGVSSISAGREFTCAVTTAGGAKCWGFDNFNQLGDDAATNRTSVPVDVQGLLSGVSSISAGWNHACAVTTAGGLKCWGSDASGQLGDSTATAHKQAPTDVLGLTSGVASVSAGLSHTCAVTTSGQLKCWGSDWSGQVGDNVTTRNNQPTPVNVLGLSSGVTAVSAGHAHTCAITAGSGLQCWGQDYVGQLGNDLLAQDKPTPVDVAR